MDRHGAPRSQLEISLPSKPRAYRPGDGPALAPVRMSLDNDTDAFIVDKRIRPGNPINGELKLELYYVVGWPDLPAARVAILATRILDYVAPRTLEDWEYKCSLERDREKEEQEAKIKSKAEEGAKMRLASTPTTSAATPGTPQQKKRGRPSKAEMLARQIAQQASFGDDELANVPLPPASTNGPSLSTPQKKRAAEIATDAEDMEETDSNEAIYKQLYGGDTGSDSQVGEGLEELGERETKTGSASLSSFLPVPSRGYDPCFVTNLPPTPIQVDPTRSKPPIPIHLRFNPNKGSLSEPKAKLTTPVPVPSYPKPPPKTVSSRKMKATPIPVPSHPPPKPNSPKAPRVMTFTPIPAPVIPLPKPKIPHEVTFTPVPLPSYPPQRRQSPETLHKESFTSIPTPSLSMFLPKGDILPPSHPSRRRRSRKKTLHNVSTTSVPTPSLPMFLPNGDLGAQRSTTNECGFALAGRSVGKLSTEEETNPECNDQTRSPLKDDTPITKAAGSRKRKRPEPRDEQAWEVKWLEDDKVLDIGDGRSIRYFKVRWKGNWPPDQNPTWEPEENISKSLIRRYLKKRAKNYVQSGSSPTKTKQPTPTFMRTYLSVADAFEGDADDQLIPTSSPAGALGDEEDEEEERLHVTEQRSPTSTPFRRRRVDGY